VSNRVSRRQANRWSAQEEQQYYSQQQQQPQPQYVQAAPAPQPVAAAPAPDMIEQLKELAQLKDQGILTEAEFDAQKAKILAAQ